MRRKAQEGMGKRKHSAAILVRLLHPGALIPSSFKKWHSIIESLLEGFLGHFDDATLSRLLKHQRALPTSASPGMRAAQLASELSSFHKVCQMLARNPLLSSENRAALAPLEWLPPDSIPDEALSAALRLADQVRPDLFPDPGSARVARGSVADVFRFKGSRGTGEVALKYVRPDALPRIRHEASILKRMSDETAALAAFAGHKFAYSLGEALRDASAALLREVDFPGEARNLRHARAFYEFNERVRVPLVMEPPLAEGIFMEFIDGFPLLNAPLERGERRETARLIFRSLILEPLFSGLPESIFHADPHAGNIIVQTHKERLSLIVLLDWSQAGRLAASQRHALIELCFQCATGVAPTSGVLERLLGSAFTETGIFLPQDAGDPLRTALEIVQQLAVDGYPVPVDLLLLRKSFLTLEGVLHQLDPDLNPWKETLVYASGVLASEAVTRAWSIPLPWLDSPAFLRTGLRTRTLAAHFTNAILKYLCKCTNIS